MTSVINHRPENGVSRAILIVEETDGAYYTSVVDAFTVMKVSLREQSSDGWTQTFEGAAGRPGVRLDRDGRFVDVVAYGYGAALRDTHCSANYGDESEDPSLDHPDAIWANLITNQINKSFGGSATGYAIASGKLATINNPTINYLEGGYRSNLQVIDDTLTIYQGYRAGSAGLHWFVDESKNLFINTIGSHENNASGWPTYWGGSLTTLVEGTDFTAYTLQKPVYPHFANKVLLYCDLRKPGTDVWTEDNGPTWGSASATPSYSVTQFIVGSHALKVEVAMATTGYVYHPSTEDAAWDFEKVGSPESPPTVNFYLWKDAGIDETDTSIRLFTTDHANDYFEIMMCSVFSDPNETWLHRSLPIGPYWKTKDETRRYRWSEVGSPDWGDINGVCFRVGTIGDSPGIMYFDDLHFAGKLIREAYNSTNITANDEVQAIVRCDAAVDDTLVAATATGTAGYLAYGELLRRQATPTTGTLILAGIAVDALPGQIIHVHADYTGAAYRVDANFRIKEVIHTVTRSGGLTSLDVTSDVLNTFAPGSAVDALARYRQVMSTDPEMKNLRTSGMDSYVPRLSKDYP